MKSQDFQNKTCSRLGLAAWLSRKIQPRNNRTANCPILSCSAPANMTIQLLACLARVLLLATCSHESPARSSHETLFSCTLLSIQHSISLTTLTTNPPKYKVTKCWNTSKIWHGIKPIRWLVKFNLTATTSWTYWHNYVQVPNPRTPSFLDSPPDTSTPACVFFKLQW